jgi:type II secretory pathway pseudopilin PulG
MSSACTSKHRRHRASRGFTLVEAIVSIALLVVVMIVSLSLLFTMRSFADRQQYYTAPRQAARRALDYVGGFAESATDMNWSAVNNKYDPNAIPTQIHLGGQNQTIPINVSYNNLLGTEYQGTALTLGGGNTFRANQLLGSSGKYSEYGDVGTDIISISQPVTNLRIPIAKWTGNNFASATMDIDFEQGCPSDATNIALFKSQIGWDGSESAVIGYTDGNGNFFYYQITGPGDLSNASSCNSSPLYHTQGPTPTCTPNDATNPCDVIHVVANFGGSQGINPPGGFRPPITRPLSLFLGQRIFAFRVRTPLDSSGNPCGPPNLEQKIGFFYPAGSSGSTGDACPLPAAGAACGSCPNSTFTPIVEGIEDMQVAWLYAKDPSNPATGTNLIWGTAAHPIPATPVNPDTADIGAHGTIPTMGVPPEIGQISVDNTNNLCQTSSSPKVGFPLDPAALDPGAGGAFAACPFDIRYVRGIRLTFVGRSLALPLDASQMRLRSAKTSVETAWRPDFNFRPAAEDHVAGTAVDGYDHNKMTTTLLVRNRMLGN